MGGSIGKKDHNRHDHDMRDPDFKRSESEESVKGSIHMKHVKQISIHKSVDKKTKEEIFILCCLFYFYCCLRFSYFGRKTETSKTIHTGTIQLKAYF